MSALLYGFAIKRREAAQPAMTAFFQEPGPMADHARATDSTNAIVTAIAALVPADVIAVHAFVLGLATKVGDDGSTAITEPDALRVTFVALPIVAALLFLIGRGVADWTRRDWIRLVIPPAAFIIWTGILGTSALTPWIMTFHWSTSIVAAIAAACGAVLLGVSAKVSPAT